MWAGWLSECPLIGSPWSGEFDGDGEVVVESVGGVVVGSAWAG